MKDSDLRDIQNRRVIIEGPTLKHDLSRKEALTVVYILGFAIVVLLGFLGVVGYSLATMPPATMALTYRTPEPQGTQVVIVANFPTPTHTPTPTKEPTHSPVQATMFAQMTATAQPTADPKWSLPYCGESTTKEGEACLPYRSATATPMPTPFLPCTEEMWGSSAQSLKPCIKTAATPFSPDYRAAPTPTMVPYAPSNNVIQPQGH